MISTAHHCNDPRNHFNIEGHSEEKFWKLHAKLHLKNHRKKEKKNSLLAIDSRN
jgi:hypothetical protein